jgi:hypothetical protein
MITVVNTEGTPMYEVAFLLETVELNSLNISIISSLWYNSAQLQQFLSYFY